MPKFKKKLECNQFCEANCPEAVYDWTRDWGIGHQVNCDMVFVM